MLMKSILPIICILIGALCYKYLSSLSFLIAPMIAMMLMFSCIKIDISKLKLRIIHLYMLIIQIVLAFSSYFILKAWDNLLGEAAFICFLCPSATASTVMVSMLRGDIASNVSYILLSHIAITIIAPMFFAYIGTSDLSFIEASTSIASRISPLLLLPISLALFISYFFPNIRTNKIVVSKIPFFLWLFSLILIIADTTRYIVSFDIDSNVFLIYPLIALFAMLISLSISYFLAKIMGDDIVSIRQSMGQKNTALAIYLSNNFMSSPIISISVSAYIIWQNIYNSYQIYSIKNKKTVSKFI